MDDDDDDDDDGVWGSVAGPRLRFFFVGVAAGVGGRWGPCVAISETFDVFFCGVGGSFGALGYLCWAEAGGGFWRVVRDGKVR